MQRTRASPRCVLGIALTLTIPRDAVRVREVQVLSRRVPSLLGFERFAHSHASPNPEGARRSHAPTRPPSLSSISPIGPPRPDLAAAPYRLPRIRLGLPW